MNAMGHNVPTMIGVDHRELVKPITNLIPDYMAMSERGMHDMTEMEMPLPDNTAPMMTGDGPFGNIGMGGMFSVIKVRANQKSGDYKDPGWFKHPPGTRAFEWQGTVAAAPQPPAQPTTKANIEVTVRKPAGGHHGH
jgi:manganese oxidase